MGVTDLLKTPQFVVDASGNKKAVMLDYAVWEELLTLLEDTEDDAEIRRLREAREEAIPWEQAKAEIGHSVTASPPHRGGGRRPTP
jgi:hypothetical protein